MILMVEMFDQSLKLSCGRFGIRPGIQSTSTFSHMPVLFFCQLSCPQCQPDDDKYHHSEAELIDHYCPQPDSTNFQPGKTFTPDTKHCFRLSAHDHPVSKPLDQQNTIE